jgi:hypothetical protein
MDDGARAAGFVAAVRGRVMTTQISGEVIPSEEPGCRDGDRSCRAAFALHGCAAIDHAIPRLYPSKEAISLAGQPVVGTTRNRAGWNAMNRGIES